MKCKKANKWFSENQEFHSETDESSAFCSQEMKEIVLGCDENQVRSYTSVICSNRGSIWKPSVLPSECEWPIYTAQITPAAGQDNKHFTDTVSSQLFNLTPPPPLPSFLPPCSKAVSTSASAPLFNNRPLVLFPKIMSVLFQRILGMRWLMAQGIQHFPLALPNPLTLHTNTNTDTHTLRSSSSLSVYSSINLLPVFHRKQQPKHTEELWKFHFYNLISETTMILFTKKMKGGNRGWWGLFLFVLRSQQCEGLKPD